MRQYKTVIKEVKEVDYIICNKCGKEIKAVDERIEEGVASLEIEWGYFSNKDGEIHQIDLCESCYDELVEQLKVPVDIQRKFIG